MYMSLLLCDWWLSWLSTVEMIEEESDDSTSGSKSILSTFIIAGKIWYFSDYIVIKICSLHVYYNWGLVLNYEF